MNPWPDIHAKKAELDRLLARHPRACDHLEDWYAFELTYTSTVIEGNTLTRRDTALVLNEGITPANKRVREVDEMRDHQDAWRYACEVADEGEALGERTVKALHALLMRRTDPDEGGRYSRFERRIQGANVVFPAPLQVPPLMEAFGAWLREQVAGPEAAIEAHYRLVSIHPFSDGNGRTSRLLMNLMLRRAGYPPLLIDVDHRRTYLDALERRQTADDSHPYVRFMAERLAASLDDYIGTARDVREDTA